MMVEDKVGNPIVSVRLFPDEVELIEAYQQARGLANRTQAVAEMINFALGRNVNGDSVFSIFDELPEGGRLGALIERAKRLHERWSSQRPG